MNALRPALHRIVIGMDFGMPSIEAARWVAGTFAPGAELLITHALDARAADLAGDSRPTTGADRKDLRAATQRVHDVARALPADVAYRAEVREEEAARAILAVATESGADVIVVGPHGGRESTRGIGTTAERLIRTSPVPVLLVAHSRSRRPEQLLVPVDGGDLTGLVLEWTDFLARRGGARIALLHVHDPGVDDARDSEALRDDEWLQRLSASFSEPSLVTALTAAGRPGEQILAAAGRLNADLVVMGRRGKRRVLSGIAGSTASDVLRRAPCPVLVVADPPDAVFDEWETTESPDMHEEHFDRST